MQKDPVRRRRARFLLKRHPLVRLARFAILGSCFLLVSAAVLTAVYIADRESYDPHLFALGTGVFLSLTCGTLAVVLINNRSLRLQRRSLEERVEQLADLQWELKEAEERAKSFLESQGDVIVRRDNAERITYANDAFCNLAGASRDEVLGSTLRLKAVETGEVVILSDGTRGYDQRIATPREARWIAWREVAVRSNSGTQETQSVGRDITDRVEAECALAEARDQAETASRAKSRFLAVVSHELRTPLNGIVGMTDLLLDTPLTPEQIAYAAATKSSADTLLALIEEILDFSKIEAGKLDLDPRPFSPATLVEECVELLAPRAQAKGIELAAYVDDAVAEQVIGDGGRVRQVLLNLIGNGLKFTERGGVSVIVEAGSAPDQIAFAIEDTGPGIAPEEQERIFLDFEQGDRRLTQQYPGTGLGLAISRQIVERLGGALSLESRAGAGSVFRFTAALPAHGAGASSPAPDLSGAKLLILAPTEIQSSLIARRLRRWGAEVEIASRVDIAAELLKTLTWDALLVDQAIGTEQACLLARTAPQVEQRIVLIAPADRPHLPSLKVAGFTGYLVTPVRAASLAALLTRKDATFEHLPVSAVAKASELNASMACGLSILVAEDNEINALLTRALLQKLGHRPAVVTNGAEAVDAWAAAHEAGAPFDVVLMDVHMPSVDGIEATNRIRSKEAENQQQRTPILALTANAWAEDRELCMAAGMDGFLVKPVERERLAMAIESAVRQRPLAA